MMCNTATSPTEGPDSRSSAQDAISDAIVMFGLTGDLGRKKLFPALYELAAAGRLDVPIVAVGRSEHSDDELREMFRDALDDHEPPDGTAVDLSIVDRIDLTYLSGDSTDSATFDRLLDRLDDARSPLVYAALPPDLFGDVAAGMATSDFPDHARLMVEKPFGADVASARSLWERITANVAAQRLFIVDHFLAKSAVENMAIVRHVNPLIANSLGRDRVASIDIDMSETGDVGGRGSFYEGVGAINDVVQSHLLQTLALLLMEAPQDESADGYRNERAALLADVDPVDVSTVVLGQYAGYRDHEGVADDSDVETYVSLRLNVGNDRWRGVPITITTGKNLSSTTTTATFHLADTAPSDVAVPNRIRFEIKPTPALALDIGVLDTDAVGHDLRRTTVYACGPEDHGSLGDYATMFDNARRGEHSHFADIDGVLEAWRVLAPLTATDRELRTYEPGTDGPGR